MTQKADLHIHTVFSDDSNATVSSVFEKASAIGLAAISITDHDTTGAFQKAKHEALKSGVSFVPGIEVSCSFSGRMVHLLIYSDKIDHPEIQRFLDQDVFNAKRNYYLPILQLFHDKGYPVSVTEFDEETRLHSKGGAPMARYLLKQGILDDFRQYDKFIEDILPNGFARSNWAPPIEQGISIAHTCGAVAILAHPFVSGMCSKKKLDQLREMGIDGIEIYYPLHTYEQQERIRKYAEKYNLYITGGSDFHGLDNDVLGSSYLEITDRELPPVLHLRELFTNNAKLGEKYHEKS